jgi:hypothetical protein
MLDIRRMVGYTPGESEDSRKRRPRGVLDDLG